jgi:NarL family two-component system response regulator LiaR
MNGTSLNAQYRAAFVMQKPLHLTATILIVEDHQQTRAAMEALLSKAFPTYRILGVDSAERAYEVCTSECPRAVVMDIVLPGVDGIKATRHIKSLSPAISVVIHSSYDIDIYHDESAAAGASAFVAKSRTFKDLVPALVNVLPPAGAAPVGPGS